MIRRPLPSPRSLVARFPWLLGTSASLRLPTALFLGFLFPSDTAPRSPLRSHAGANATRHRPGACLRFSPSGLLGGNDRISQVPEGPLCLHALLSDPGRISVQCRFTPRCCLPPLAQRRLLRCELSGLNHTACRLPVYASQDELPHHHATLGSGCRHAWPGWIVYQLGPYERFPELLLLSSFLRLRLAHAKISPLFTPLWITRASPWSSSLFFSCCFHRRSG
jgi:hypothetical protein